MFFAFEGTDGAGKTTQCERFVAWLREQGRVVECARDPGSTQLGDAIRQVLLHDEQTPICRTAEMLLFMAARAQLVAERIKPALRRGEVFVTDRYLLSTVVYQGHAGGLDVDTIWSVGHAATGGLLPDLTFVLDLPDEAAANRLARPLDRMEQQGDEFRRRLRQGFLTEAARRPDKIVVIDATASVDEVQARVRQAAARALKSS